MKILEEKSKFRRAIQAEWLLCCGMQQRDAAGMQVQPTVGVLLAPVQRIVQDGAVQPEVMGSVNPKLVRSTGDWKKADACVVYNLIMCYRWFSVLKINTLSRSVDPVLG
jgi:hypothetical protein